MPLPCLPVDSASSCSSQEPMLATVGEAKTVSLSRPARAASPRMAPRRTPGLTRGGDDGPQARTMGCVVSRKCATLWPMTPSGTMPKTDSTE